jgi:hypothetical protein
MDIWESPYRNTGAILDALCGREPDTRPWIYGG